MSYKIAIGSSDGINVDLKFGEVKSFLIYEVDEEIKLAEERIAAGERTDNFENASFKCGNKSGCSSEGNGCGGAGNGCGGPEIVVSKVADVSDCRCVVCKKIGFQAQKQFEKRAIAVFDVECSVKEALEKISYYYKKIDSHEPFRKV